jgi:hypothetical protein
VPLLEANFDTVGQQIVLPEKVLFLHQVVQFSVITF